MDAKNDCNTIEEMKNYVACCYRKLEDELSSLKNGWQLVDRNGSFEGKRSEEFRQETQKACDSVCVLMDSLNRMTFFLESLDEKIIDYDRTQYEG